MTHFEMKTAGKIEPQPVDGLRVLLAEDNPINRKVATRILERQGHLVVTAENGRLAVQTLEQGDFDVILMDVQMPEMDGFAATAVIREREAEDGAARIPIVAVTAHAMKGYRERCLAAGMDAYVTKPVHANELFAAIEEAIDVARSTATTSGRLNEDAAPQLQNR